MEADAYMPKYEITDFKGRIISNGKGVVDLSKVNWFIRPFQAAAMRAAERRKVTIKNKSGGPIKIFIGDEHTFTTQTIDNKRILVWTFSAIHSSFCNTHHWARITSNGKSELIAVYGDGVHSGRTLHAHDHTDNDFLVTKSGVESSFANYTF